ncbi:MAG: NAD(P)-dependent oxidoreductase [Candidatus Aenigmatarchaeota archaeon]
MILVTGASGFIGSAIVPELLSQGYSVRALCRSADAAKSLPKKADASIGDVTIPETLGSALHGVDTVIHLAGMVSYSKPREELFRVNAIGTRNLLDQCGDVKKFVLSSSVSVYGQVRGEADESYPVLPGTPYGESKAAAERFVSASGIRSVVLRIAPIYGKGSEAWVKNLELLDRGFPIPSTRNLTHVVHVTDAVQAIVKSVEKGEGTYNIASEKPVPFVEFAEAIVRMLGKKPRRLPSFMVCAMASAAGMKRYMDVLTMNRNYSIRKAREELGYAPKADFESKAREMVEWYRGLS